MQLVRLTWRDGKKVKTEYVELLDEDSQFYTFEGQKIDIPLMDIFAKEDYVMFEDYDGIFGLKPSQIVSIEVLHNRQKNKE